MNGNKMNEGFVEGVEAMFGSQPKFLTIVLSGGVPELHVRGEFGNPLDSSVELAELSAMSEEYRTIRVFINSVGGNVDLLTELVAILGKFENVITIGGGTIASAGFMLWCMGDLRVIQPYTWVMHHRESYGMAGKTKHHKDLVHYNDRLYGSMMNSMTKGVLTEEEQKQAEEADLYLPPEELVERGACIMWDTYVERQKMLTGLSEVNVYEMNGIMFIEKDGLFTRIDHIVVGETKKMNDFVFDVDQHDDEWYADHETEVINVDDFDGYWEVEEWDGEAEEAFAQSSEASKIFKPVIEETK